MPATTINKSRMQLLADWGLQCRPVSLPSERFNARAFAAMEGLRPRRRATHIQR